jgi:hypothetical protein
MITEDLVSMGSQNFHDHDDGPSSKVRLPVGACHPSSAPLTTHDHGKFGAYS